MAHTSTAEICSGGELAHQRASKRDTIVLIGPSSERYKGGIAQFTQYLADELSECVDLVFLSWYQMYPPFLISRDFRDRVSRTATADSRAKFVLGFLNPFSWLSAARRIAAQKPKVVYLTWNHPVHAPIYIFLLWYLRRYSDSELVLICHNVLPHESFPGACKLTCCCMGMADRLVVHSSSEALDVDALLQDKKVTRLFLPLHDFFHSLEGQQNVAAHTNGQEFNLLFFGHIREYKGLDILLRALPLVLERYPAVRLHIAGEMFFKDSRPVGVHHAEAKDPLRLITELGLEDIVTTDIRYIPNEEIPTIFSRADAVVFPFRSATQSGSLTVAYSYSKPVIATRVGGLPDVVRDGISGFLVEPESSTALAGGIIKCIEETPSSESVMSVAEELSWRRYVDGLLDGR